MMTIQLVFKKLSELFMNWLYFEPKYIHNDLDTLDYVRTRLYFSEMQS